jgi:thiamine pyrophosphokinase
MRIVVVASGELDALDTAMLDAADRVIAADGGASSLERLGRKPDELVGDLDSTEPDLVARLEVEAVSVERHATDKEASDTELAIARALASGASEIVLLGATGGKRLDHELANVLLIADPALAGRSVRIVRGRTSLRALHGGERLTLEGGHGDLVTLLPIGGDAIGVTTAGLRWALVSARLAMGRSRGLSNEVVEPPASVSLERGALLVVETANEGAST